MRRIFEAFSRAKAKDFREITVHVGKFPQSGPAPGQIGFVYNLFMPDS